MRPAIALAFVLVCNLPSAARAQAASQPRAPEDVGTVTGHILCSDTQRPARLAEVRLVPVGITAAPAKSNPMDDEAVLGSRLPPVQTDMSGAFTVHNVHPGTYYLRVDYTGYLTPLLGFTRDQLAHPTAEMRQRMASELQTITVAPHATTRADATIPRGASISGTVLYDDGSPAAGINLSLFRLNAKGEFKDEFQAFSRFYRSTDDHGRFHIDSLPADSFVLAANFSISETSITTMPMPNGGSGTMQMNIQKVLFSLPLYSGSALRLRDAAVIKTDAGQETPSVDLTLPLSKLHSVSGTLVTKSGHTINAGKVALLYADTREELTNVPINRDDNQFHFLYVPEGNYVLAVQEAKDVTQVEVPNPAGSNPKMHLEDKTVNTYGTTEQPLVLEGEQPSVLVTVPEKSATP
jgi:hypothetical protein